MAGIPFLLQALALWSATSAARLAVVTERNDTYTFVCATATFGAYLPETGLSADFVLASPYTGCDVIKPANGSMVLMTRGGCDFAKKARNAQAAGAVAMVVADEIEEPLVVMTAKGPRVGVAIAAVFVTRADGNLIRDMIKGQQAEGKHVCRGVIYPTHDFQGWSTLVIPCAVVFAVTGLMSGFYFFQRHRHWAKSMGTLSKEQVASLPCSTHTAKTYVDRCAICLEEFEYNETVRVLPCDHEFHAGCVDRWLTTRQCTCPICKRSVFALTDNSPLLAAAPSRPSISAPLDFRQISYGSTSTVPRVTDTAISSSSDEEDSQLAAIQHPPSEWHRT